MFQQFIIDYAKRIMDSLGEQRETYDLHELAQNQELPTFTRDFILSEISWWAYCAVLRKDFGKHFPIEHEFISLAGATLQDYLKKIAICDGAELLDMIRISIETHLNALARPMLTSTTFLFRNDTFKTGYELHLRSSALKGSIPIIEEVILACIGENSRHPASLTITKDHFIKELQHSFTAFVSKQQPFETAQSFSQLFELIHAFNGTDAIPIELFITYFDESKHMKYAEYFRASKENTYSKESLNTALHNAMGQTITVQEPAEKPTIEKRNERSYFANKGIMLIARPRTTFSSSIQSMPRQSFEEHPMEFQEEIVPSEIVDTLLPKIEQKEKPLNAIRPSFLGSIPIDVQVHYAQSIFDGNLNLLRKLGASIDKTVNADAAMLTCKAYVNQYGMPIRDVEDPLEGLFDLIQVFCKQREH